MSLNSFHAYIFGLIDWIGLMNSIKLDGNETISVLSPGLSFNADVSSLRSDERANVQNVSFESFYGGHQSFH